MAQEFKHLFSPLKIGSMTTRNRIYSSPHHPLYYDVNTLLHGDRMNNYWVAKAKGGIGMIGTYLASIAPGASQFRNPVAGEAFKRSADAVQEHGAKLICQLANQGAQAGAGGQGPSAVLTQSMVGSLHTPRVLTREVIKAFPEAFAHAAVVCQEADADGVEVHGSHGYLITQFMSPNSNRRTDEYGGSLENRMRFVTEILQAVRAAVGDDYPVGIRVTADEFVNHGYTLDDMLIMAPMLVKAGKLDWLNISTGTYASLATAIEPMYYPLNSFVYCAAAIKQVVDIPVFARGRIQDPVQAEAILASNQADGVSMVRPIMADPEWPNKAREGRVDEIRKCLACNEGCWGNLARRSTQMLRNPERMGASCTMNPVMGREEEPGWGELIPAEVKKRVMIIGGGPAGLETARVATLRGHQVSLYDKGSELGGQTLIAAKAPGRDGWLDLGRYQTYQMKILDVDVHLNTEVTAEMVKEAAPDVVVIATGAVPIIPDIPGIDGDNVVDAWQVLQDEVEVGNNVVIISEDQDIQSLSTADFLAERGKKVQVLTLAHDFGSKLEPTTRTTVHQRLFQNGVTLTPYTGVSEISGSTITTCNRFTFEEGRIEGVDTVVVACGSQQNNALYLALQGQVGDMRLIGDAFNAERRIHDITMEGATLGRAL